MNQLAQPLIDLTAPPAAALDRRRRPRVAPGLPAALALAGLLAAACGGTDRDFAVAERSNTQSAWEDYLRQHPQGEHTRAAQQRLAQLVEAREWEHARSADSVDAYQQYLRGYPQGPHAPDATNAVANLNLAATPTVEATMPPEAKAVPAAKAAPATRAAPATKAAAAGNAAPARKAAPARQPAAQGFRVQFGAFAKGSAAASAAWQALVARYPELRQHEPIIAAARAADGRAIHRLQAAGFDRAGATALCRKLTADRRPCLLVPPRRAPTPASSRSG